MFASGTRFSNDIYVKTTLDVDNGNCVVEVELINNEGEIHIATGNVVWGEGE